MDMNTILLAQNQNTILEPVNYHGGYEQQNNNHDDQNHDHLSLDLSLSIHPPRAPPQMAPNLAATGHHHPIMVQPPFQPAQSPPANFHPLYLDLMGESPTHHFYPPYVNPFESSSSSSAPPQQQPPPSQSRASSSGRRKGKHDALIMEPYPWATNKRAIVHTLEDLRYKGISTITGQLQCKDRRCLHIFEQAFNLQQKFREVARFVMMNKNNMHNRAPERWLNPVLPVCPNCNQSNNNVKPYITKKKSINWLFMFLGEYLSCCRLSELKYFCKHANHHRTGAKDRLVYLTYIGICKQLDPQGPYSY